MHEFTITDVTLLAVIVSYLTLCTGLISWGYQKQEEHPYFAYFLYGLSIVAIFIFMPLTLWFLAEIGWIHFPPPSNLTEVTNLTL